MNKEIRRNWPLLQENAAVHSEIVLKPFGDWTEKDFYQDGIVAFTDGWKAGEVAAVLRGGINARGVLDLLAQSGVRNIKIIHIEEKIPQLEEVFVSSVVVPANAMFDSVTVVWRREASLEELVRNVGPEYPMLFFGAPLVPSELMPMYEKIRSIYGGNITIVRGLLNDIEFDAGDEIYKWVRERTYEADDFALPAVLRSYKKKLNKKITVVLPSLNEEKTVGDVIKTALEVKQTGIIDEVILMDSASTDRTVEIAQAYGIPVFLHPEVRLDLGAFRGKGEAMYKSAFVSDADILAWIDTDIESITPSYFYGLLGPMLTNEDIKFSKGYFARPVRVEASGVELGGGRVTEILARPWINVFMPELSGYIQPLAGTVAIYRDSFLKMRVPTNYGVEMAMLIQALQLEGLWATCQVNLGDVVHKSKDVLGLGEMAFQITNVLKDMGTGNHHCCNQDTFRRVYSANGRFEIGIKKFKTIWRDFDNI